MIDLSKLEVALSKFASDRDWEQFHSPKNLVMALTGEVGELNEIFQWLSDIQSQEIVKCPEGLQSVSDELADILMYLVRLATVLDINLDAAVQAKFERNHQKYPIAQYKGSSAKAVSKC